jgi:hypothetical protein
MPRVIMLIDVSDEKISELWSNFEKMVEDDSIQSFFSLCQDGQSLSHELPSFMIQEQNIADILEILESNFVDPNKPYSENYKTGEEHMSLEYQEEQRQAWYDHTYGPDLEDYLDNDRFEDDEGD